MKRLFTFGLVLLNVLLVTGLVWNLKRGAHARVARVSTAPAVVEKVPLAKSSSASVEQRIPEHAPETPFMAVYSSRPFDFANNLRRVGCPEETVRDILTAEINRGYHKQEEALRPKPADHVPWMWSPKTSEPKLLERRQESALIAREKEGLLRNALGYDVPVEMPLYAMTTSDQQFQESLGSMSPENRVAAHQAQEQYWMRVEQLQSRTHGFWEPSDVEELNQLKAERSESLARLEKGTP